MVVSMAAVNIKCLDLDPAEGVEHVARDLVTTSGDTSEPKNIFRLAKNIIFDDNK
jgi:hypothetical protein